MMKRGGIYMAGAAALLLAGCDDQRDLHSISSPALQVECDWVPSLDREGMQEATAMFYKGGEVTKEFFSQPDMVKARVSHGRYDILAFNGVMESEIETNLNHIFFRGTERPETFEACAVEAQPVRRLTHAEGEYIASNDMELFARAYADVFVEGGQGYYLKYKDGHNGYPVVPDHIESVVNLTPRAVSYYFQVKLTNLVNVSSARSASGALRGFAGSVFLVSESGMPKAGFSATHHLNLTPAGNGRTQKNSEGSDVGAVQSPRFVTFGPPLPESLNGLTGSGRFTFELSFLLTDNTEYQPEGGPIDITAQVNRAIAQIYNYHKGTGNLNHAENLFVIEIDDPVVLPVVIPENVVEVEDWDDNEEIMIWMR